ncbi:hypothetical protein GP2143_01150 [marine gamma proteobacterium HTCC2143]|uniref:Polysaccharide lyase n=1 Tax=marine gamma proteobacterium HTCC2143 TaxID=247633 RepID=A0YGG8_9GAMM|nr:hypothetical protein GP2143_01150 [marine gamma proteobacterium HTCC2143]
MKKKSPLLILALSLSVGCVSAAEKTIESPDWSFQDDFEGSQDTNFWGSQTSTTHGISCSSDPRASGNSLLLTYIPGVPDSSNGWAEKRFHIPVKAQQFEISYRQFVPANYQRAPGNHKNFVLWSGPYGKSASNISISSENWPTSDGATPSVYIGVDGNNYAHSRISDEPLMLENAQGNWQNVHIYVELAEREGDFGVFEIHRNGEFLTGTSHPDIKPAWQQPPVDEHIEYSSRGNYIDQGYLMGWANGGFAETTIFCIDDFIIKANTTIRSIGANVPPMPPAQLRIEK